MESHDNFAYLLPFIFLAFGCVFLAAQRFGTPSARYWGFGYIAAALGFSAPVVMLTLPLEAHALVSNAFFFLAYFLYGHALLVHFARPTRLIPRIVFALLAFALVGWIIVVQQDLRAELIAGDVSLAVLLGSSVAAVIGHARRVIDRLLVSIASLVVIETLVRIASMLAFTSPDSDYGSLDAFLSSDYAFFMQVGASVIGFVMALTVLGTLVLDIVGQHRRAAEHDALTDLLNRRGFERAIPDFSRDGFSAGAVLVFDIDHFKLVNDRFGHAAGDAVIVGLAASLGEGLPGDAPAARFGGEEFVAFLPGVGLAEAEAIANAIRLDFSAREWSRIGIGQPITVSCGLSLTARGDHSMHDAIGRADACLYAAKTGGRNRVMTEGQQIAAASPQLRIISVA